MAFTETGHELLMYREEGEITGITLEREITFATSYLANYLHVSLISSRE